MKKAPVVLTGDFYKAPVASSEMFMLKTVENTWCETGDEQKRNIINITVTAGSVIIETPVLPVIDGDYVTLHCRNKTASSIVASFYKNGLLIKNVSTGNFTIHSVSRADEGLYKCSISGAGESPESWLTVREYHKETISLCSDQLPVLLYLLIRTVVTGFMGGSAAVSVEKTLSDNTEVK
ncbi:hypothetical protein L3Q82_016489 [Scortum barcoo]|uniref:Uncharacterized protein n=1 Tax=Scortum barcoo TaxID=214431 RepID=A0ACB8X9N5_9TELE|nr:hypothetical protein L3Q82_016489 [Scortum barcoo]